MSAVSQRSMQLHLRNARCVSTGWRACCNRSLHVCPGPPRLRPVNKSLSIDLAPEGITAVLLHPGYVRTDMTEWHGNIDTQTCVKGARTGWGPVGAEGGGGRRTRRTATAWHAGLRPSRPWHAGDPAAGAMRRRCLMRCVLLWSAVLCCAVLCWTNMAPLQHTAPPPIPFASLSPHRQGCWLCWRAIGSSMASGMPLTARRCPGDQRQIAYLWHGVLSYMAQHGPAPTGSRRGTLAHPSFTRPLCADLTHPPADRPLCGPGLRHAARLPFVRAHWGGVRGAYPARPGRSAGVDAPPCVPTLGSRGLRTVHTFAHSGTAPLGTRIATFERYLLSETCEQRPAFELLERSLAPFVCES